MLIEDINKILHAGEGQKTEFSHPDGTIIYIQVPSSFLVHEYAKRVYVRDAMRICI